MGAGPALEGRCTTAMIGPPSKLSMAIHSPPSGAPTGACVPRQGDGCGVGAVVVSGVDEGRSDAGAVAVHAAATTTASATVHRMRSTVARARTAPPPASPR